MTRFFASIKNFFFPPEGTPTWLKLLPYVILGVLTILLLTAGVYGWEYTNSPEFCGQACHTMPPEYTSYLTSPHARIDCVDCHIGKGFIATRITRKAGDLKHVTKTIFHDYEFPIRAHDLQPARETCELCHLPEKFSDDSLREIQRYENDVDNTPISTYLTMKTGGGSQREGLGRGIHWHIENPVYYFASDPENQEIPYVKMIDNEGNVSEYIDTEVDFDPADIDETELKEMDCITCHNRITHLVPSPEDTIDQLIARGAISDDIPEIRNKALQTFTQLFETTQMGLNNIAGLDGYYKTYYPDYYAANQEKISAAIEALQDAYSASVYPEQNSDWTSHPNNIGHKDSPGCFRCHDGKHLNAEQEAIRLECNLCHSIPIVAGPYDFTATLEISRGPEPQSHLNENWISLHHQVFDATCENCHTTSNPGGTDNSSFCSNSACHGTEWVYAGFDAPGLREALLSQLPESPEPQPVSLDGELTYNEMIGALLQERCGLCHGQDGQSGLDLTNYESILEGGESGPAVIPGDAQNSLVVIKYSGDTPHFGKLSQSELDLVAEWIMSGAPE